MRRVWAAVCTPLFALSIDSSAGDLIVVDLQLQPSPDTLRRGDFGTMRFTIENVGDSPLDLAAAGFTYRTSGTQSTLFPFRTNETPPCYFAIEGPSPRPGEPALDSLSLTFMPTPVAIGERRSCVVGFQVSPFAAGPFVQLFGFVALAG